MLARTRFAAPFAALLVAQLATPACNDKALDASAHLDGGKRLGSAITAEQAAKVLAKVGEHTITLGEFVAAIEHMDQFDRLRYQSPERRRELLAEMINIQLLADEAVEKGYDKEPKVQEEMRAILRDAMLAEAHKGAPTANEMSEADVRAYYDKNRAMFHEPERRRLSAIVLGDAATAADVLAQAKKTKSATEWGELVRAKSTDPAAKANVPIDLVGDFGLVSPPAELQAEPNVKVPLPVRTAIFTVAAIGDIYDGVIAGDDAKFYVVRLTQKTDAHERTYAEAERSIRVRLVQEKIREREEALLAQLKTQFPVQIDDAVLATVRVDLAPEPASPTPAGDAASPNGPHSAPSGSASAHPPPTK
jgi:peptidyl-prolyl cis-trans isomerase C